MDKNDKNFVPSQVNFSKESPIVELPTKQSQVQTSNIVPPIKPKEIKKNWGDKHKLDDIFNW